MNNSYITIIKEKRTALSRKRVPLNQNECTDDFRIGVPFEQNLQLIDLEIARTEGNYRKVMTKYANPLVLILDEWLLLKPTEIEQKDIFELLHRRRKKSSTIFCSQYRFEEWYDQLGGDDSPLADAIIDRIAHDSYRINITSIDAEHDISMREVYGLDKMLRE